MSPVEVSPAAAPLCQREQVDSPAIVRALGDGQVCFIQAPALRAWLRAHAPAALDDWAAFQDSWNDLRRDQYMADGGRYRFRRYATLALAPDDAAPRLEAHQPHYQSLDYNRLNGGVARHFEPILPSIVHGATMAAVLGFFGAIARQARPGVAWHIEAHQFRIVAAAGGAGNPTPEGAHRDGVDFVLVLLVRRVNVDSGTTRIFDPAGRQSAAFTLTEPLDTVLLNDHLCLHGVTPIVQHDARHDAYRDVLVVTFRQDPQYMYPDA